MELTFEPIGPWWLVTLIIVALAALIVHTARHTLSRLPARRRVVLTVLRGFALALLAFGMLRPAIRIREDDQARSVLFVLGDASRSMQTTDGPASTARRQHLVDVLESSAESLAVLKEETSVRQFDFSEELTPAEEWSADAEGEQSAIGSVLDQISRLVEQGEKAVVVLLSDGAQRAIAPHDDDPRSAARLLAERQIPVYTSAFGSTALLGTTADAAIEDLQVDPVVFERKTVPVQVRVRAFGLAGRRLQVRLLKENRSGLRLDQIGPLQPIPASGNSTPVKEIIPDGDSVVIPVDLSFIPEEPGEFTFAAEVVPVQDETLTKNNLRKTVITVRRGGLRVVYFDRLRPEQLYLRAVNTTDNIQLDFVGVRSGAFQGQTKISPDLFERGRYDAFLIGDVPASVFGDELLSQLSARVADGAGLMMIGGVENFGAGGYAGTPLADWLPVRMAPSDAAEPGPPEPLVMVPTERGLRHYLMRLAPQGDQRELWAQLPPLEGATPLEPKSPLVEILAVTDRGDPLLMGQTVGRARVLAYGGDTTYLWMLAGHADAHQRFWRRTILWLTQKDKEEGEGVWVDVSPRTYAPGAEVDFRFGLRDAQGNEIPGAAFSADVTNPAGENKTLPVRLEGEAHAATFDDTGAPGDYLIRVRSQIDGQPAGFDGISRFIVEAVDLELDNPAADPTLLSEISAMTGGRTLRPEELPDFFRTLSEQGLLGDYERVVIRRLWDNWAVILLFCGALIAEWWYRKRIGLA